MPIGTLSNPRAVKQRDRSNPIYDNGPRSPQHPRPQLPPSGRVLGLCLGSVGDNVGALGVYVEEAAAIRNSARRGNSVERNNGQEKVTRQIEASQVP
jgi:hypothetical protein